MSEPVGRSLRSRLHPWILALALAVATLATYDRVPELGWLSLDATATTLRGVGADSLLLPGPSGWQPLAWLSLALDRSVLGLDARGAHVLSLVLHLANTLLLFSLVARALRSAGLAALAAALFALHPLSVEAVAWVSARGVPLSILFTLLALHAYASWVSRPRALTYLCALAACTLSVTASVLAAPLPLLLFAFDRARHAATSPSPGRTPLAAFAPFAAISLLAVSAALLASGSSGGALLPRPEGLARVALEYAHALERVVWPVGLSPLYPVSVEPPAGATFAAWAGLAAALALALRLGRSRPLVWTGLAWFALALLPAALVAAASGRAVSDREVALPLVGLALALAAAAPLRRGSVRARAAAACACVLVLALSALQTRAQLAHWRDDLALWKRAFVVTEESSETHVAYGRALAAQGNEPRAFAHFRRAVIIDPNSPEARLYLGRAAHARGNVPGAIGNYQRALELRPDWAAPHVDLGRALGEVGNLEGAISTLQRALKLEPGDLEARLALATALQETRRLEAARVELDALLERAPSDARALTRRGAVLHGLGRDEEARADLARALGLDPHDHETHTAMGAVHRRAGEQAEALARFRDAYRLAPDRPEVLRGLAWSLATAADPELRDGPEALRLARRMCDLGGCARVSELDALAAAQAQVGRFDAAARTAANAARLARERDQHRRAEAIAGRAALYRHGRVYLDDPGGDESLQSIPK